MGMMLPRIKSDFQVSTSQPYPISFTSTSPFFHSQFSYSQEDNDQAFPVTL